MLVTLLFQSNPVYMDTEGSLGSVLTILSWCNVVEVKNLLFK